MSELVFALFPLVIELFAALFCCLVSNEGLGICRRPWLRPLGIIALNLELPVIEVPEFIACVAAANDWAAASDW